MSISLNLTNLVNLQNETTAVNAINANNSAIITAFQDAFALEGTAPNSLNTSLDMNGNAILNLPAPVSQLSPLRLIDANLLNGGGSISAYPLPTGGSAGTVLIKNTNTNFDVSWSNTVANLVVTGSFSAPGIVSSSLLNSLPITLGTTSMLLGNTYSSISGPITFSGSLTLTSSMTLSASLNYGGVALSNAVTGTGNMVLSNAPTLTGTLTFGVLSPTSLSSSVSTITGLTVNSSPVSASDYVMYYSSANAAINKISIANLISSTVAGVTSIGGTTGVVTLGGSLTIGSNILTDNWTTGDVKMTFKTSADPGWLMMNDQTIGSASSGATYANSNAQALFTLIWNNVNNSSWAPVSGGYGVSAAADWAANKTIALPRVLGRTLAASGAGSGLITYGLGVYAGENLHALTQGELPAVAPTFTGSAFNSTSTSSTFLENPSGVQTSPSGSGFGIGSGANGVTGRSVISTGTATGTISDLGSGTSHNNMQPTSFVNIMIKL